MQETLADRAVAQLMQAKAQGLLEALLEYLDNEVARRDKVPAPTGPEWPFVRAVADGETIEADRIRSWIVNKTKPSPDGAENTED